MERLTAEMLLPETIGERDEMMMSKVWLFWAQLKAPLIVPILRVSVNVCLAMSIMLFIERVYMGLVIIFVKLFGRHPEKRYKWEAIKDDMELGSSVYPLVLIQIPMYNEREVYKLSIGAACQLSWPSDRMIIQVLDDSTDQTTKELVEMECKRWGNKGINIKYQTRDNRYGYKAGALKEGMKHSYAKSCDYVAIFDADFQPDPNFLHQTIPFLMHNPKLALVQARWKFDECLLTRMQEMSLDYHFAVEQEVGSSTYAFFGFNGTAGVWRISAINEARGWKDRTTVEDMDLAVRASLKGWKFLYLDSVRIPIPTTPLVMWPTNLFRKMVMEIIKNEKVSIWKKMHVIYSFFFVRKIIAHIVSFSFYCIVLPATILAPEVTIPKWGVIYLPSIITFLNAFATLRVHMLELVVGLYLMFSGFYDIQFGKSQYFIFFFIQAFAFFIVGFGYVGTFVPAS